MKKEIVNFIFILIIALLGSSCCKSILYERYGLHVVNYSNNNICCYFYLVWEGGKDGVVYPDTILSFDKKDLIYIDAGETFKTSRSVSPITEWISSLPNDTISFYFFNNDSLNKYSWEDVQQTYKILQRYDLSSEDVRTLYDQYGIPEIPYPPTEAMKNMKMYPRSP